MHTVHHNARSEENRSETNNMDLKLYTTEAASSCCGSNCANASTACTIWVSLSASLSRHFPFHTRPRCLHDSAFVFLHLLDDGVFSICEFERRKFSFETYAILIVGVYLTSYVYAFDRENDQISPLHYIKVCCMSRRCYTTLRLGHIVYAFHRFIAKLVKSIVSITKQIFNLINGLARCARARHGWSTERAPPRQ